MQKKRTRLGLLGVLTLALCVTVGMTAGVAEAQKKKKGPKSVSVNQTQAVNAPIPDRGPGAFGIFGQLASTINVGGKKFKKQQVRDANVTIQATGAVGATPITDLRFQLTAPNGASTFLWTNNSSFLATNTTLGPFTADDESRLNIGSGNPVDPSALFAPWQGSARPDGFPLSIMDNTPIRGAWTLLVQDVAAGETSVLNSWRLNVVGGRKYLTK